jgi:hypothetical protein
LTFLDETREVPEMKSLASIMAGGALLVSASLAQAASPGLGGPTTNTTTPGAIGGTQQSLQPTDSGAANPTSPSVDIAPGTAGGPSYNPTSETPTEQGSAGTAGTNGG